MSDMSRPGPPPAAAGHDAHDPLLVAQLAAGDALDTTRQQEAQTWLAICPACMRLAADLRAVSEAVAREPVPPRRRHFYIDPGQAERLRGNTVSRFLRRLTLPRARAFQPAAAGALTLGLVFVVAGYAWPDGGQVTVRTETAPVPGVVEERLSATATPSSEGQPPAPAEAVLPSAAAAADTTLAADVPELAVSAYATEELPDEAPAELPEGLAEHQAGSSAREAMKQAVEAEFADDLDSRATGAAEPDEEALLADGAMANEAASESEPRSEARDAPAAVSEPADQLAAAAEPAEEAAAVAPPADSVGIADASAPPAGADGLGATTAVLAGDDGPGVETWLIALGSVLAVGGLLLLLLGWLSRRTTDPLLR